VNDEISLTPKGLTHFSLLQERKNEGGKIFWRCAAMWKV